MVVVVIRWDYCPVKSSKYFDNITGPKYKRILKSRQKIHGRNKWMVIKHVLESEVAG